ncbi:pirin family protein, partial [Bordetella holmesii]
SSERRSFTPGLYVGAVLNLGAGHRDSTGQGGVIGPGDVQWMTAAGGILHEEFHSPDFSAKGGELEMVQLWVNLPAAHKMAEPGYQAIGAQQIPQVDLPLATLRVIAGEFGGTRGPARTHTPMNVWDLRLSPGGSLSLGVPDGHQAIVVVLRGTVLLNEDEVLRDAQLAVLAAYGEIVDLEANNDALVLILSGEPIDEPIVGHGPFVMNSREEIVQAFQDFESGRFIRSVAR